MYKQKVNVFVQARMGSKRLPGKVLKKIQDKTLLEILINRLKKSKALNDIIVLTTKNNTDDVLASFLESKEIKYFRGDEDDVLDRYYNASKKHPCDYIVRITGDCPLIDANLLDEIIDLALNTESDYCSNIFKESFPDGQDIEIFKNSVLIYAWQKANLSSEREHVTPFIIKNTDIRGGDLFKANAYESSGDYSKVRMTVDTLTDFNTIEILIDKLGVDKKWEIYTKFILDNYEIFSNQAIHRNLGYKESLKND